MIVCMHGLNEGGMYACKFNERMHVYGMHAYLLECMHVFSEGGMHAYL